MTSGHRPQVLRPWNALPADTTIDGRAQKPTITRGDVMQTFTIGVVLPTHVQIEVRATWNAAGRVHDEIVEWPDEAKGGERRAIWVDDQGDHARPPSPPSSAASDAVGVALFVWLGVIAIVAGAVSMIRRRLDHGRYAQWEHEINASNDRS
jgi:hypothetical protein